ncbi:MAG TPA: hypothetical protein VLL57_08185 [Candidatus Binataceae bacterium]|nr:hypothetical protein [Candidatus Binataceae bacterium]
MSTQPNLFGFFPTTWGLVVRIVLYSAATALGGGHLYMRNRRGSVGPGHETEEGLRDEIVFGDDDAKKLDEGLYFNDAPFVAGPDDGFQFRDPPPPGVLKEKADQQK